MKANFSIAIDGPVGVGKGTLAEALAQKLGATYIYTGGMYRALTLAATREGMDLRDEEKILELLSRTTLDLKPSDAGIRVLLNGEDVTDEIFLSKISRLTPVIAAFPKIRQEMVRRQKLLAEGKSVVMEGRDIATDVLPGADLKVHLTADLKTRAERRLKQLRERGIASSLEEIISETEERDRMDMEREASPLIISEDAFVLDTTNLTIEATVGVIISELKKREII
ncbi:MAG: cytidylate kinase [Candidatus Levybacteria bacterium GW2011_GWA2_40_8]|nr:MAG: cytidylate kinase [Candidatus Levybacteria bacterium GW2011_GWA2_40_8]